ncbi:MAG: hypothetical protein IT553_05965 [Sphingomonadaceae bacterium]|nr:hypothetical protein [Sphingomonadaceae bacterium]
MATNNWMEKLDQRRTRASASVSALSDGARDAATAARARIASVYGEARNRADSSAFVAKGRGAYDKALHASRGLVAERPIAAIAAGLVAGAVLGYLANNLVQRRRDEAEVDDEYTGG